MASDNADSSVAKVTLAVQTVVTDAKAAGVDAKAVEAAVVKDAPAVEAAVSGYVSWIKANWRKVAIAGVAALVAYGVLKHLL